MLVFDAMKMLAINFAEWLSINKWVKRQLNTHPNKIDMYWSDRHFEYKTIEELYEMFLIDEKNKLKKE